MDDELNSEYEVGRIAPDGPPHALVWLVCVLLLYWISQMWLMAHRGRMHDDPLVFALRNRVSRVLVALMAAILFAAT